MAENTPKGNGPHEAPNNEYRHPIGSDNTPGTGHISRTGAEEGNDLERALEQEADAYDSINYDNRVLGGETGPEPNEPQPGTGGQ